MQKLAIFEYVKLSALIQAVVPFFWPYLSSGEKISGHALPVATKIFLCKVSQ